MRNIISNKPGVTPEFRETKTERDAFELLLTKAMIENMVNSTNASTKPWRKLAKN